MSDDEDCLQSNIWIPSGEVPANGWPVYFYIHGGFLQVGGANEIDPVALLSETSFKAIIVMSAYRLNVYGFLASQELLTEPRNKSGTVGNLGFWDQRLALQWIYTNISYFGGDPGNITVAGYSAGSHSVFYQLAYDLDYPPEKRIIKRVCMHANGPGVQPKALDECQEQFEVLLHTLRISSHLPPKEKLRLLRETPPVKLRKAIKKMRLHQFRAVTDGHFVKPNLFEDIQNGVFAKKLLASQIQILIGESAEEHFVYADWRPPANTAQALLERLPAEYPRWSAQVLKQQYFRNDSLPPGMKSWKELFGRIYADVQVHVTERGFIDALARHCAAHLIHRYRIDWRSGIARAPEKWGATHWADDVIWFFGNGKRLPNNEKRIVGWAFTELYAKFVAGEVADWGAKAPLEVRRLRADGEVDVWRDEWWDEKLKVWNALQHESAKQDRRIAKPTL